MLGNQRQYELPGVGWRVLCDMSPSVMDDSFYNYSFLGRREEERESGDMGARGRVGRKGSGGESALPVARDCDVSTWVAREAPGMHITYINDKPTAFPSRSDESVSVARSALFPVVNLCNTLSPHSVLCCSLWRLLVSSLHPTQSSISFPAPPPCPQPSLG